MARRKAPREWQRFRASRRDQRSDREKWLEEFDKIRYRNWTGHYGKSSEEILAEDREDRI
jgi:hypothetical protein